MGSKLKDIANGSLDIVLSEVIPGKYQPKVKEKIFGTPNLYYDLEGVVNFEKFVLGGVVAFLGFTAMTSYANMIANPEIANRTPEEIRLIGDLALKTVLTSSYVGVDGLFKMGDLLNYRGVRATSLVEFPYRGIEFLVKSVNKIVRGK